MTIFKRFRQIGSPEIQPQSTVTRQDLAAAAQAHGTVLEIGPFYSPSISGPNVKYADVLDKAALARKAEELGASTETIPTIDYVSEGGDLSIVPDTFDAVFSAHCIEHQPDLIRHLRQVRNLLRDGGKYFLIVPDKRYCFDHYLPASTADEARAARGQTRHPLLAIIKHVAFMTHNSAERHWAGDHHDEGYFESQSKRARDAIGLFEHSRQNGNYVDVHGWQFTPASFANLIGELQDETGFELETINETPFNLFEFTAILKSAGPASAAA